MKTIKKIVFGIFIGTLTVSCMGCGGSKSTADSSDEKNISGDTISNQPVCENTAIKGAEAYDQDDINEHTFTYGHINAAGNGHDVAGKVLSDILSQKTDGKMRVEVYDSGQLGTDESMKSDCISGSLDFYSGNISSFQTLVPEVAAFDMPFFYDDLDEFHKYLLDNEELFDEMSGLMEDAGFKLLKWQGIGWRQLSTNREITGPDSIRGMALRIPTVDSYIAIWQALGASTTAINSNELFLALQQGMVEAQENPYDAIYTYGFGEVQKYVTNSKHLPYFQQVVMSLDNFDKLTETEQQVIMDAGEEMAGYVDDWAEKAQDYYLQALQDEYGMTFIDFDEIEGMRETLREETFEPVYNNIKKGIKNNGGDPNFLDRYVRDIRGLELPS